jgi:ubiquinone/menaquinone biosynthesis C-methylase UbiE
MKRIPEPELMDAPEQVRAYAEADFDEPNVLFVEMLTELVGETESQTLIDLGCGPGDICIRLAQALPDWHIVGLDAGPNMLAMAAEAVKATNLEARIELVQAHLPNELPDGQFGAITSNSLLHHLPEPMALWQSIRELARPGCWVQVMDLHRPADIDSARALVDQYAADAPEVLRQDFFNSLLAAYTADEVEQQFQAAGLRGLTLTCPSDRHWLVQGRNPD